MNLHWIDWSIIGIFFSGLVFLLYKCQKHMKSTADFLAANRCAGRYLLAISDGIAGLGAITVIASFELYFTAGFTAVWWVFLSAPVGMLMAASGWVIYRFRETKALTMPQFFEIRYSRKFRIFAGIIAWLSGMINYGLFPAITARFFIYYCGFPTEFKLFLGIPFTDIGTHLTLMTYPSLLILMIGTGIFFAVSGGQISIMVTDFIQGIFCNIAFLVLLIYLFLNIGWDDILTTLIANSSKGTSLINPYQTAKLQDFNIWYFLIGIYGGFYVKGAWLGAQGYQVSAKSPHEAKMAALLGVWRGLAQSILIIFIPICAFVVLHHLDYLPVASQVNDILKSIDDPQIRRQVTVSATLVKILPVGLVGIFAAVMLAATISTDNTYMHSWGSIFIQDVVMPFRKKPFNPKQHILMLRLSIVFVGIFAFCFSYFFRQTESILLFFSITGAIFTGGAGAVIIGGLYWKKGTASAAWIAMILGSVLSVGNILLQQFSPDWFMHNGHPVINGQWGFLISMVGASSVYIVISLVEHFLCDKKHYNLHALLNREGSDTEAPREKWYRKFVSLKNFTIVDKVTLFATIGWGFGWFIIFLIGTFCEFNYGISNRLWAEFWKLYTTLGFALGSLTTLIFLWGGIVDMKFLFKKLAVAVRNDEDDGRVIRDK